MLLTDIRQSFRQMATHKLISFVQIIGLGIGLGSVILMLTFILHEYSFDKYHKNGTNIYRVVYGKDCSTPYIMGETFRQNLPEVKNAFRIYNLWNTQVKQGTELIKEDNFFLVDSAIFSILDISLLSGDRNNLLADVNDILISDQMAQKYFGGKDPVGKQMEISMSGKMARCNITGVFRHFPSNSSIRADFMGDISLAFQSIKNSLLVFKVFGDDVALHDQDISQSWENNGFQTFLLLGGNADISALQRKMTSICQQHDKNGQKKEVQLQNLTAMYLHSEDLNNTTPLLITNLQTIKVFEGIALLLLILACFNYILLSTAQTQSQLKEIACRKVLGASFGQITQKNYAHSLTVCLLSLFPALLFVKLLIPFFNQLLSKNINFDLFLKPQYLMATLGVTLLTGLAGGGYVGLYASRLKPVNLFKPAVPRKGRKNTGHAGILIVFQFVVFIFLFSSAGIIEKQIWFSENKGQGFDSNNILIVRLVDPELRKNVPFIKTKLETTPHVLAVAPSFFVPPSESYLGLTLGDSKDMEPIREEGIFVGGGLLELLKIPFVDGTSFPENERINKTDGIIINEAAAKKYKVRAGDRIGTFTVRGIVRNFHAHTMHTKINPLIILRMEDTNGYELAIRTDGHNANAIDVARKACAEILPAGRFEYEFLNDRIKSFYKKEKDQVKTVTFFSFLAIALAIMGLFGYVSISLLKRTKEIGVRKVNGGRIAEIMLMLNKTFVRWVAFAFVIACPIAWYVMHKWLQDFAYKTALSWWVFALAGLVAVAVAILTVSWQSWRAATRNPVESLRYE